MAAFTELWTEEGKKQTGIPWDAYPRPGMLYVLMDHQSVLYLHR